MYKDASITSHKQVTGLLTGTCFKIFIYDGQLLWRYGSNDVDFYGVRSCTGGSVSCMDNKKDEKVA